MVEKICKNVEKRLKMNWMRIFEGPVVVFDEIVKAE